MPQSASQLQREKRSQRFLQGLVCGKTLQDIADEEGISRQAVRQALLPAHRAIHRKCREHRRVAARESRERARARQWANKPEERFWENVNIRGKDKCWEWGLARYPSGYGRLQWGGRSTYAHRIAWELTNGLIPDGMCVCHHCDNPPCCNPAHLFLGTRSDNTQDSIAKGRWADRSGENSGRSKLTWKQVGDIRRECAAGGITQTEIARRYGVSDPTISAIVTNKSWKQNDSEAGQ